MGYRIREEFVAKERAAMSDVTFARERLGIVDESRNATVVDMERGRRRGTLSSPFDPVCFAIDIGPDAAFTSIAVAGATPDGRIHTEVVDRRRGTGWVVDRIEELRDGGTRRDRGRPDRPCRFSDAVVRGRGCPDREVGMREHARACGLFKVLVEDGRLVHKEQPGLTCGARGGAEA
jgi:hypothetical protein